MPIAQLQLGHGGAEMQAHRLARALIARGHEVEIVTSRPSGEPETAIVEGVPVRRLFAFGNRRLVWRLAPYSVMAGTLAELLRRRADHDVVHAHQAFHPAFAAVLARRLGGRPVVVKVATAGEFGDLVQMQQGRPTLPMGSAAMLRAILDEAAALVAISAPIAAELRAAGVPEERLVQIPNGVELAPLPTLEERAAARVSLGLDAAQPVAVYVGRAGAQKGADLLAAAWRQVATALPAARLLLLGEGLADVAEVAAAARALPSLTVVGRVADVPRYLAAADLFVLPSRGEGLSNALLEAMAHGLACVVSDLPANLELVEPGQSGWSCPVGDVQALAALLIAALSDGDGRARLGAAARRRVEARFTLDAVAAQYEALYTRLVAAPIPNDPDRRGDRR